jgi:hypothetical protein
MREAQATLGIARHDSTLAERKTAAVQPLVD